MGRLNLNTTGSASECFRHLRNSGCSRQLRGRRATYSSQFPSKHNKTSDIVYTRFRKAGKADQPGSPGFSPGLPRPRRKAYNLQPRTPRCRQKAPTKSALAKGPEKGQPAGQAVTTRFRPNTQNTLRLTHTLTTLQHVPISHLSKVLKKA